MYDFIKIQYEMGKIDKDKVLSYAPKWITVEEADSIINVGVSGPGVVKTALEKVRGEDFETLCEMIKRTAFKVTRVGQLLQSVTVWLRSWKKSVLKEPAHLELQQLLPC